ncbi:MAG TPA: acetyl-CoA hydrolase/transferase C-terminal domain-containing protein [Rubrobacteraceae bacterium]|nr:acetyl-CoA hydrolase/transferase C-terminal domain-containing protein [Rubrobacteraceae bacterium]
MTKPPNIEAMLSEKRHPPEAVLDLIPEDADLIVGLGNGEPVTVLDAIEARAENLSNVRIHQMLPLRKRPHMHGDFPGLRHVSWFLSPANREAFREGTCDLVPNNFSDVPRLMRQATRRSLVVAAASPSDRHGYFSLGCHAEYLAAMMGEAPFFVEVNRQMPRTFGENQVHVSQLAGFCEADYPLAELPPRPSRETDRKIAALVAERIPDGATLQAGIGAIPNEVLGLLGDHKGLGVHTELLSDGFVDLVQKGVVTGANKRTHRNKIITTTALGSRRLYEFVGDNPGVEFWPVNHTNDPRNIAKEDRMNVVNATLEVDFLGQCASESLGSEYWSSSGGQPDFARGAIFAEHGQAFIVLHSTTADESVSRIVAQLHPGAAVTTFKNVVDKVVTEYGVAELRGSSIRERTRKLIGIAHPKFRDDLENRARGMGYL